MKNSLYSSNYNALVQLSEDVLTPLSGRVHPLPKSDAKTQAAAKLIVDQFSGDLELQKTVKELAGGTVKL